MDNSSVGRLRLEMTMQVTDRNAAACYGEHFGRSVMRYVPKQRRAKLFRMA